MMTTIEPYSRFADCRTFKERMDALPRPTLMRVAFIPFVVGRIVWDYVGSIIDLTRICNYYRDVKLLNRRVLALQADYERRRNRHVSQQVQSIEANRAERLQKDYAAQFSAPYVELRDVHLPYFYPELKPDSADYLAAVYMAMALCDALARYALRADMQLAQLLGVRGPGSVITEEIKELRRLLPLYLGDHDKALRREDIARIADSLFDVIDNIPLNDSPITPTEK